VLEATTTYKNYPLTGTLKFRESEGYYIFLAYELSGALNKKLKISTNHVLTFLQEKETELANKEEYELAHIMKNLKEQIINKLDDYK